MAVSIPNIKLNNGNEIPTIGLGTFQSKPGELEEAIEYAIDIGYRYIDTAHVYQNERQVGAGINAKLDDETVKREDLFVVSKLWCTYHDPKNVDEAIRNTLSELGLEYLDLYLIHWPMAFEEGSELFPIDADGNLKLADVDYLDTWKGMEQVLQEGLTKNIGISNFNSEQVERLLQNCTIKPVLIQIEVHPYLTQKELSSFCQDRGLTVAGYSPLGSPSNPWAKPDDPKLLDDEKIVEMSEKYNKTPAQVVIRYQIDRGHVVIPKSATKARILENAQVFDFELSPEDVEYMDSFDIGGRIYILPETKGSPYWPFNIPY